MASRSSTVFLSFGQAENQQILILIVESGSTKADWVIINNGAVEQTFLTPGLNPFSNKEYADVIRKTVAVRIGELPIDTVYFYGAGIVGTKEKRAIAEAFGYLDRTKVTVNDDLIAAAIATCGNDKGVVCILGTGSNIGYYDGREIVAKVASGGYLLGSEGSGMALGREVLKMYIRDQLSARSVRLLESAYDISKENIFDKVYNQNVINRYVASFAPMVNKLEITEKEKITQRVFTEFLDERILKLEASRSNPIHFVGSIAYSFRQEIEDILKNNNLALGNIVDKPIDNLVEYHTLNN